MQSMLKMHHHYHLLCTTPVLEFPVCCLRMPGRLEYVRCRTLHLVITPALVLVWWMSMGTAMHTVMATVMHTAMATVMAISMIVAMADLWIMLGMSVSDFFCICSFSFLKNFIIFLQCNSFHALLRLLWCMIMNDSYRFRTIFFFIYARCIQTSHIYYTIYHCNGSDFWW